VARDTGVIRRASSTGSVEAGDREDLLQLRGVLGQLCQTANLSTTEPELHRTVSQRPEVKVGVTIDALLLMTFRFLTTDMCCPRIEHAYSRAVSPSNCQQMTWTWRSYGTRNAATAAILLGEVDDVR
jgi:hypothetical protein